MMLNKVKIEEWYCDENRTYGGANPTDREGGQEVTLERSNEDGVADGIVSTEAKNPNPLAIAFNIHPTKNREQEKEKERRETH